MIANDVNALVGLVGGHCIHKYREEGLQLERKLLASRDEIRQAEAINSRAREQESELYRSLVDIENSEEKLRSCAGAYVSNLNVEHFKLPTGGRLSASCSRLHDRKIGNMLTGPLHRPLYHFRSCKSREIRSRNFRLIL